MSIPNVSTLFQRIQRGSEGGSEFARIVNQLLVSESELESFKFSAYSDASGDYKGVDGIINRDIEKVGLQYKFYPTPLSANHKHLIKESLKRAMDSFPEMDRWILIIPEDPKRHDMEWIESNSSDFDLDIQVWGHTKLINLMLKHRHIGINYYPELNRQCIRKSNHPTKDDIDNYFGKFLDPDADLNLIILKAQPTLSDCKAIFTKDYYEEVCDYYYLKYKSLVTEDIDDYHIKTKQEFELKSSTYNDIINKTHHLPGGVHMVHEKYNVFNPNTTFYKVTFKMIDSNAGVSFNIWCFLNNRWVFFPKPLRVIYSIEEMRQDKDLKRIINVLKWFGVTKRIKHRYLEKPIILSNHIIRKLWEDDKKQ